MNLRLQFALALLAVVLLCRCVPVQGGLRRLAAATALDSGGQLVHSPRAHLARENQR